MTYLAQKTTNIAFTPEGFYKEEQAHLQNPTDRKQWLKGQLINIEHAIYKNKAAIDLLADEAAQLDGKSDAAQWISAAGALVLGLNFQSVGLENAAQIKKYSSIAGAAMIAAGVVINIFERKKDNKRAKELYTEAIKLRTSLQGLEAYRQRYRGELNKLTYLPMLLFGAAIYMYNE